MAGVINLAEGSAPSTPGAATHSMYVDTSGNWHTLSDGGVDKTLANTDIAFVTANLADLAITTAKIADEAVTNAKLANMAEATIKGRAAAAGTGAPTDLTAAELAAILATSTTVVGDADWIPFSSLGTYWTTSSTTPSGNSFAVPAYRKVNGVVYLRGAARVTSATSNALGTLPVGYRPAAQCVFAVGYTTTSITYGSTTGVKLSTDGTIRFDASTNITYHLDGISFVPA